MLKYYFKTIEALKPVDTDEDGVVSFEYVLVAACMVTAVVAAFGPDTTSGVALALQNGIAKIVSYLPAA
jgi:pilus assembly protein Flp/PilA